VIRSAKLGFVKLGFARIESRIAFLLRLGRDDRAAQMVEFAVALPLLVVFVVGIFDFSGAFTLRQKLTNLARDTARAVASDPSGDITTPGLGLMPASINDGFQIVLNYLTQNHLSTCGMNQASAVVGPQLTNWTFTGTACPPATLGIKLDINRGYYFPLPQSSATVLPLPSLNCAPQAPVSGQVTMIATCVTIQYAYPWRFGKVAGLFGFTGALPTMITATAVALNED
jgi:hypothetical protein